jgi:hypothetical protein
VSQCQCRTGSVALRSVRSVADAQQRDRYRKSSDGLCFKLAGAMPAPLISPGNGDYAAGTNVTLSLQAGSENDLAVILCEHRRTGWCQRLIVRMQIHHRWFVPSARGSATVFWAYCTGSVICAVSEYVTSNPRYVCSNHVACSSSRGISSDTS